MRGRRVWVTAALAAVCAAALWAQGVIVCKACGREAKPGATACSHCAAPLPAQKAAEPAVAAEPPADPAGEKAAEIGRGAAAVVEANVRLARELEKEQPEVALNYYQNALALMRLVPAGTFAPSVGEAILAGNGRLLQAMQRGTVKCRKCKGSGKYQFDLSKVDKTGGIKEVSGVSCPMCKGSGSFPGYRESGKFKMALLQGRSEFERRQMVLGDVKVGRALIPASLEQKLSNRQRALMMTAMPAPCSECQLTGRQPCSACKGSGWVKCDYKGCSKGLVKVEKSDDTRQSTRLNDDLQKTCPKCGGLSEVKCEACGGTTGVACKKCDGSGVAPRCAKCTGTGLMTCTKCKGTGEMKGAKCPECKGEALMLCTTCRGEGAQLR